MISDYLINNNERLSFIIKENTEKVNTSQEMQMAQYLIIFLCGNQFFISDSSFLSLCGRLYFKGYMCVCLCVCLYVKVIKIIKMVQSGFQSTYKTVVLTCKWLKTSPLKQLTITYNAKFEVSKTIKIQFSHCKGKGHASRKLFIKKIFHSLIPNRPNLLTFRLYSYY